MQGVLRIRRYYRFNLHDRSAYKQLNHCIQYMSHRRRGYDGRAMDMKVR